MQKKDLLQTIPKSPDHLSVPTVYDLTIVVVSYNTAGLLKSCLTSVYQNTHPNYTFEVIVVDNASIDGSANLVRQEFPLATLIPNEKNLGFASANNQALKIARGKFIVLLNPDTEVVEAALWKMAAFLESEPYAAVVGPCLLYPDRSFQEGAFKFPGLAQIFFEFFPLNWRLLRSRLNGRYPRKLYKSPYCQAFECDFILGACLMLRRTVLEQVGPLDANFFMYMEEIDWCYRIKKTEVSPVSSKNIKKGGLGSVKPACWRIYCLPSAKIVHHAGASSRQFRDEMFFQLYQSRKLFYKKHYSRAFQVSAILLTQLGMFVLALRAKKELRQGRISSREFEARKRGYDRVKQL